MPNYSKGKIYKIIDDNDGRIYVGSTTATINHRLGTHVAHYIQYKKGERHNQRSYEVLKGGKYHIELIQNYPCSSRNELEAREHYYINTLDCVNKICNKNNIVSV